MQQGKPIYLAKGKSLNIDGISLAFDDVNAPDEALRISDKNGTLEADFRSPVKYLKMDDKSQGELKAGANEFNTRTLYTVDGNSIVLKSINKSSKIEKIAKGLKPKSGEDELSIWSVKSSDKSQIIELTSSQGQVSQPKSVNINGINLEIGVGAKAIKLPFAIYLEDFKIEHYPGSKTPSSFASDVILHDKDDNVTMPYNIYMNHVLDYKNYRLFQSSYDPDELGTVLSVNHDPGTNITYLGYFILAVGLLWSIFTKNGRFQKLLKESQKLKNSTIAIALLMLIQTASVNADESKDFNLSNYDANHIHKFQRLVVQDMQGRMKPVDTIATDVMMKVSGKTSMFNKSASELFLSMMLEPDKFEKIPMIQIGHKDIAKKLGLNEDAKYAKFTDFFDGVERKYKLFDDVQKANQKPPLEKSQYDKELIKIDERMNVAYMTFMGSFLRIYPKPHDISNSWFAPLDVTKSFEPTDAKAVEMITGNYFGNLDNALKTNDWKKADEALELIGQFQSAFGAKVMPSPSHIDFEIAYNHYGLFSKLVPYYLILGLLLIVVAFIGIVRPKLNTNNILKIAVGLLALGFLVHLVGLGLRWYISGNAPWSNAYEAVVFIAASTVLAGLLLARKSIFALSATAILAGATMAVAHMSFMNPEITPLVPVLKSYWLMIHVAMIVSGDGFFGLGFILSMLTLILFVLRSDKRPNIDHSIKELTILSEMSLMIGLVVFTIGNFLGGVWANESWGRYWGWDPKETWAAVTILVYASVLHMRFIPKLKGVFAFNVATMWAYSSVLMTYFGVNYYLSGLHSYAAGDPMPIPAWVYYAIASAVILTVAASFKNKIDK
jgi:cytochrome c-type biogenesis protein CcsB